MTANRTAVRRFRTWSLLFAFLAAEFCCFEWIGAPHYTWLYPRWNDQIQYLTESYTAYESARADGWARSLGQTLVNPAAQGTLHDFLALLVFRVTGPSRGAALSLNLLHLIAWQIALFVVVRRRFASEALAWVAVALTLCLRIPWTDTQGSAFDFRLDWMTACAMGLCLALALRTEGFRCAGWSALFGVSVGLTLATRFLTGVYFILIFAVLLTAVLSREGRWRRMGNLFLAAAAAIAVAGPPMWLNRVWISNYYLIGHFTGPESAIRSSHMGVWRSAQWVGSCFLNDHLGTTFLALAGAVATVLFGAILVGWFIRRRSGRTEPAPAVMPPAGGDWWVCGLAFALIPAAVLILHDLKSAVVISVVAPGAVVLVVGVLALLLRRAESGFPAAVAQRWAGRLAAAAIVAAAAFYAARLATDPHDAGFAESARKVNALADQLYDRACAAKLPVTRVAVDRVTDCLDGQVLKVICYERHHVWFPFVMTLPTGIAREPDPSVFLRRIADSDFVFLTEDGPEGFWPYDHQLRTLLPENRAWCDAHLRRVERFTLFANTMVLYQRREIP